MFSGFLSVRPSVRPLTPIFCVTRYLCRLLCGWISVELAVVITENICKVRGQGRMCEISEITPGIRVEPTHTLYF